ncbi:hypothetical protein ACFO9E_02880 [Streptomyces maoxianensis]|uniref:Uncharacterized protein n=1 Tax=Streptomyces maoxianensis TaxID=1459942 RepID=A0ABV9G104_9ACTN
MTKEKREVPFPQHLESENRHDFDGREPGLPRQVDDVASADSGLPRAHSRLNTATVLAQPGPVPSLPFPTHPA